eukprot:1384659-Lingulodinium_polyedra.AAC.1
MPSRVQGVDRKRSAAQSAWAEYCKNDSMSRIVNFLKSHPEYCADVEKFCFSGVLKKCRTESVEDECTEKPW